MIGKDKIEVILELQDKISKQLDVVNAKMKQTGDTSSLLSRSISNIGTGIAVGAAINGLKNLASQSIEAFANQEQFLISLKTLLKGNEYEAKSLNDTLIELAKTTPFQLTDLQQSTRLMIAYGSTSKGVVDEIKTLGDVAAGTSQPLNEIAYLYGTVRTQGQANLIDLKQFANRGIPIFEALGKVTKYTSAQIVEGGKNIKISFRDVENAFKSMTSEGGQFFNLMKDQQGTLKTSISNLGDAWEQLMSRIGESNQGVLKSASNLFSELINEMSEAIAVGNRLDQVLSKSKGVSGLTKNSNFNWWQRNLLQRDKYDEFLKLNEDLDGKVRSVSNDPLKAQRQLADFANTKFFLSKERIKLNAMQYDSFDKIEDLERRYALISDKESQLKDAMKTFSKNKVEEKKDAFSSSKSTDSIKAKDPNEIRGNQPKVINITINDGLINVDKILNSTGQVPSDFLNVLQKATMSLVNGAVLQAN